PRDWSTSSDRSIKAGRQRQSSMAWRDGSAMGRSRSRCEAFVSRSCGARASLRAPAVMSIDGGYVLPPTPPPDIDLEAWSSSIAQIDAWSPATLFITHCGPIHTVRPHLQAFQENLAMTATLVRESLQEPGTDEGRGGRVAQGIAAASGT